MGHQRGYRALGVASRARRRHASEGSSHARDDVRGGHPRRDDAVLRGPARRGEPRGGVVVVQEAFGVNDHIQDVTRRFAAAGYHAMAPHLFHRAGGGTAPYGDFAKVLPLFEGLDRRRHPRRRRRRRSPTSADRASAAERIGIVGFCFGGRVTFLVAARAARSAPRSASTAAGS